MTDEEFEVLTDSDIREMANDYTALRVLANHLRYCRECGETDVERCSEGWPLWVKCFPADAKAE